MISLRRVTDIETEQNKQRPTNAVHDGRRDAQACRSEIGRGLSVQRVEPAVHVDAEDVGEEQNEKHRAGEGEYEGAHGVRI